MEHRFPQWSEIDSISENWDGPHQTEEATVSYVYIYIYAYQKPHFFWTADVSSNSFLWVPSKPLYRLDSWLHSADALTFSSGSDFSERWVLLSLPDWNSGQLTFRGSIPDERLRSCSLCSPCFVVTASVLEVCRLGSLDNVSGWETEGISWFYPLSIPKLERGTGSWNQSSA